MTSDFEALILRLWRDERGQDIIEYGLLCAIFGIAAALVFPLIEARMGNIFSGWEANVYTIWEPWCPGTTAPCP